MITETKATELILATEPGLTTPPANIFKLAGRLAQAVRHEIVNGEFAQVQRHFDTVEALLKEGNATVRMAISNVFLYSITNTLSVRLPFSIKALAMLPLGLKKEYYKQLNASSI